MQRKPRSSLKRSQHDVAIIGGAFAGAATAILLKRARPDLRVLLVESKERFDRKVGESAIEVASWFLTKVLGLDRHLALEQLPKYGLRFWFMNDRVGSLADASELGNLYQTRVPSFHVDRAVLDEHVLRCAVEAGANLLRPARVLDAEMTEGSASTLLIETDSGHLGVEAKWIIDASGRRAWLARRMGLLHAVADHPTRSIWARYRRTRDFDGDWLAARRVDDGGTVCSRGLSTNHLTGPGWWVWAIPLPGGELSVGLVWDERIFALPAGASVAQRFDTFLRGFPAGRELIGSAEMVKDDIHALNALPYRVERVMGDGWALVGDASGFMDPLYSPGLDWAAMTIAKTVPLVAGAAAPAASLTGEKLARAIADHNTAFTTSYRRWSKALYRDKYYYLGDIDLMEVALRLDVSMYYLGVVTGPYRKGIEGLDLPFTLRPSLPFYLLMSFVNRRLARLGRRRLRAGTWGRRNAGRRVLLHGFKLGPGNLLWVPGVLARLLLLELRALRDLFTSWRRWRPAPRQADDAVGASRLP